MRVDQPGQAGVLAQIQVWQISWRAGIARIDAFESSITDNDEAATSGVVGQAVDQRAATNSDAAAVRVEWYFRNLGFRIRLASCQE